MDQILKNFNLAHWIIQTVAMMLTCFFIPRLRVSGPIPAFITVVVLAFINAHYWDAALFLQIPNTPTMHAVSLVLVNGIIFWIVVKLLPGIEVEGFLPALVAPVVFSVLNLVIGHYAPQVDWAKLLKQGEAVVSQARDYYEEQQGTPKPTVAHEN
jgi:putative membrane protein